jgi:hypothetical protein
MKWFERNNDRFQGEKLALKRFYPKARLYIKRGRVVIFLKVCGRKRSYIVQVIYPNDFPYEQPKSYIIKPKIKKAPHRFRDGSLSIHGKYEGPRISGKIILDWSVRWIQAYENWLDSDEWPDSI